MTREKIRREFAETDKAANKRGKPPVLIEQSAYANRWRRVAPAAKGVSRWPVLSPLLPPQRRALLLRSPR